MARRKERIKLGDLVPEEVIESTSHSTISELSNAIVDLERQLQESSKKYERKIQEITKKLETQQADFKNVLDAIERAKAGSMGAQFSSTNVQKPLFPTDVQKPLFPPNS